MDNFDLKKYLVENKVTRNSRMLTEQADREAKKPKHSRMMKEDDDDLDDDWQEVAMHQHNEYLEDILADLEKEKGIRPDVNIGWSIDDEDSISSKIYSNPTSIFTTYHKEDGSIFTTDLEGGDMGEAKKPKHSRMVKEQDSIPTAIQETATLLKKEGIPFTMVTEEEMEDELQNGIDPGEDTAKSVIKLKGSRGNVYIAEFGYGSISVDAKNIDEDYPKFWEELGEDEYATDSGKDIIRVLKKYFMKGKNNPKITEERKGKFYAPQYLVQKYGKEMAKKIEAEIYELDANSWDRFTAMESAEEVGDYIADILDMLQEAKKPKHRRG